MKSFSNLKYFLGIAFPLIVSHATENTMFFMDRFFLSHYGTTGSIHLNASLTGALVVFFTSIFFISLVEYTNTLVAQYFGAKQIKKCALVTFQGMILSCIFSPIIILISLSYERLFLIFDHSAEQLALELSYSRILVYSSIFMLLRVSVSGFFMGIGETKIIMLAHLTGMIINLPLNYLLIFGIGPFPEMGIEGAALATVIGFLVMDIILYVKFFSRSTDRSFSTRSQLYLDWKNLKKLIRYGTPFGIELTLALGSFTFFILAMNGYGNEIGSAVTIAINWDSVFFIPMFGASFATTVVTGQHLGQRNISGVKKTLKFSLGLTIGYALIVSLFILVFTPSLIKMFISNTEEVDRIYPMANAMLKMVCFYIILDALQLSFSGVLRGAGDTAAVMYIHIVLNLIFGGLVYYFILPQSIPPISSWAILVVFVIAITTALAIRYHQGKWQKIDLIS